jgi:hypothetical protein
MIVLTAVMGFGEVTAAELAFYFDEFDDLPFTAVNSKLKRLIKKGPGRARRRPLSLRAAVTPAHARPGTQD